MMSGSTGPVDGCPAPVLADQPEHGCGTGLAAREWPLASALEFGSLPTAVGSARAHTRGILAEWGLASLADDAEIVVSELLTNALRASWKRDDRPPVALRLLASQERLIIEAWDQCADDGQPTPELPPHDADHGRGLLVVAALGSRWGVRRASFSHKVVWCELLVRS